MEKINGTMMQYFEWYLDCKQNLWNDIAKNAEKLSKIGITAIWLPPAYKGLSGKDDVGYSAYDLYDLGEFNQKGTVKTKYGSKDEYINMIQILKQKEIESYADIVLNHKMGADGIQTIPAKKMDFSNHKVELETVNEMVKVATKYTFPGRKHKYSNFEWNWTHFDAIDYNSSTGEKVLLKFKDKEWDNSVDDEFGNYDYLMGTDLDFSNPTVVEECKKWGKWYLEMTGVSGFRLDAIKHISTSFYKEWIDYLRTETKKELFTVGEYWSGDIEKLHNYLKNIEGKISLFDVPLHFNFFTASNTENYDLSKILDKTLLKENPLKAVTFVDNHDTQPGQALTSFISKWFKPIAYVIILLRAEGYPCVFYGDFYGIAHSNIEKVYELETLIHIRKQKSYGEQHDYFDNPNYIGWTREGDKGHKKSGLAVVISNAGEGEKRMYIGKHFSNCSFVDILNNCKEEVIVDSEGFGNFKVRGKSVSVWIRK